MTLALADCCHLKYQVKKKKKKRRERERLCEKKRRKIMHEEKTQFPCLRYFNIWSTLFANFYSFLTGEFNKYLYYIETKADQETKKEVSQEGQHTLNYMGTSGYIFVNR